MLKKRIIPCLDIKNGRTVKGVNFENLRDAGDAVELAKIYSDQGADELVFLDISATQEGRATTVEFAKKVAKTINIPFTIGGGIASVQQAQAVILAGADKVGVNSAAVKNPLLIKELSENFGAQAVVLAIDAKKTNTTKSGWEVFVSGGKISTGKDLLDWAKEGEALGAGEILLTSMDCDGVKEGFDESMLIAVGNTVSIPLIASGGAGQLEDFVSVFQNTKTTGALAASVFHFGEVMIPQLKEFCRKNGVGVRG